MKNSRAIAKLNSQTQVIRILSFVVLVLLFFLFDAHNKILNIPKDYNIWIPPDIENGGFANLNEPEKIHILNFAIWLHDGIYTWDKDGKEEFEDNVDAREYYLSRSFRKKLKTRATNSGNDYKNVKRNIFFDFKKEKHWKVVDKGNGRWHVTAAIRTVDTIADNPLKDEFIKYSYIVDTISVSKSVNPFGLIISGEFSESMRMR